MIAFISLAVGILLLSLSGWWLVPVLLLWLFAGYIFYDSLKSREERIHEHRKLAEAKEEKEATRFAPPPGAVPPPNGKFLHLTTHRAHGLKFPGTITAVICGQCAFRYDLPSWVISNFRSTMTYGARARRFNNPVETMNQRTATDMLRCPNCGSVDPGVWVAR